MLAGLHCHPEKPKECPLGSGESFLAHTLITEHVDSRSLRFNVGKSNSYPGVLFSLGFRNDCKIASSDCRKRSGVVSSWDHVALSGFAAIGPVCDTD